MLGLDSEPDPAVLAQHCACGCCAAPAAAIVHLLRLPWPALRLWPPTALPTNTTSCLHLQEFNTISGTLPQRPVALPSSLTYLVLGAVAGLHRPWAPLMCNQSLQLHTLCMLAFYQAASSVPATAPSSQPAALLPCAGGNQLSGTIPDNLQLPPNLVALSLTNNRHVAAPREGRQRPCLP